MSLSPASEPTEEHIQEFLETFAKAVLHWGYVEMQLFLIFSVLVGARNSEVASAVYHSVVNFRTRLTMIDSAAEVALQGNSLLEEWKRLSSTTNKRAQKRNSLAHLMVAGNLKNASSVELCLRPSIFDVRKAQAKEYDLKQIREFRDSFQDLVQKLDTFQMRAFSLLRNV